MRDDTKSAGDGGRRRSRGSRFLEFLLWAAIAVGTAVLLVSLSETLLPANF